MPTENPRITIAMTQEELDKIESYRFAHKFANRTQAILDLVQKGLAMAAAGNAQPTASDAESLHNVVRALTADEKHIIMSVMDIYRKHMEQANDEAYTALARAMQPDDAIAATAAAELKKNRESLAAKSPLPSAEESGQ